MKKAIFKKSLTIALSSEQYKLIKRITNKQCISMGEWVREALATALTANPEDSSDL
jgi:hypothetical protein